MKGFGGTWKSPGDSTSTSASCRIHCCLSIAQGNVSCAASMPTLYDLGSWPNNAERYASHAQEVSAFPRAQKYVLCSQCGHTISATNMKIHEKTCAFFEGPQAREVAPTSRDDGPGAWGRSPVAADDFNTYRDFPTHTDVGSRNYALGTKAPSAAASALDARPPVPRGSFRMPDSGVRRPSEGASSKLSAWSQKTGQSTGSITRTPVPITRTPVPITRTPAPVAGDVIGKPPARGGSAKAPTKWKVEVSKGTARGGYFGA